MKQQIAQNKLTNLQLELLKLFSYELTDQELLDIKDLLAHYFAQKATQEMDIFWETHNLTDEIVDEWLNEHHRIPYK
jgi:hypothetical protein